MGKTYRWDDKHDPRKDSKQAKQEKKLQGMKEKQFLKTLGM